MLIEHTACTDVRPVLHHGSSRRPVHENLIFRHQMFRINAVKAACRGQHDVINTDNFQRIRTLDTGLPQPFKVFLCQTFARLHVGIQRIPCRHRNLKRIAHRKIVSVCDVFADHRLVRILPGNMSALRQRKLSRCKITVQRRIGVDVKCRRIKLLQPIDFKQAALTVRCDIIARFQRPRTFARYKLQVHQKERIERKLPLPVEVRDAVHRQNVFQQRFVQLRTCIVRVVIVRRNAVVKQFFVCRIPRKRKAGHQPIL